MAHALRLMVYDRTCRGRGPLPGLSASWRVGGRLYGALGRLDAWKGVASWGEALAWLLAQEPGRPIREVQYWGHGRWGCVLLGAEVLDSGSFEPGAPWGARLRALRERLVPGSGLIWLRTCESFGTERGHAFASTLSRFFGCQVAGHTYVIGPWQSGLHRLRPGERPGWPVDEGVPQDAAPAMARWSRPWAPNTITCFRGSIPDTF